MRWGLKINLGACHVRQKGNLEKVPNKQPKVVQLERTHKMELVGENVTSNRGHMMKNR